MRPSLFSRATLEEAAQLPAPEADGVMPGTWHILDGDSEYRVQTDEEIEDGNVYWASCTCPHGLSMTRGIARCAHVAAVLMIILEEPEVRLTAWCSPGPIGSKPPHKWGNDAGIDGCPGRDCECWCHDEEDEDVQYWIDELI